MNKAKTENMTDEVEKVQPQGQKPYRFLRVHYILLLLFYFVYY